MATEDWPALTAEPHAWISTIPHELVSRAVRESHAGDYRASIVPEIATRSPLLPVELVRAMEAAVRVEGIDRQSVLDMHRELLAESAPDHAGRWRSQQVWLGRSTYGPHQAEFVPPHHARVEAAMSDLSAFASRDDLPVLVHAALLHAQFETIHPFVDGNGRTGRALLHVLLRRRGLVRNTVVPVSAGLLHDTDGYVAALTAYRTGDVAPIVRRFVDAADRAVRHGRELVADLDDVRGRWNDVVVARRGAAAWAVVDLLFR